MSQPLPTSFRHGSHGHPGGARAPELAKTTCASGVQDEVSRRWGGTGDFMGVGRGSDGDLMLV